MAGYQPVEFTDEKGKKREEWRPVLQQSDTQRMIDTALAAPWSESEKPVSYPQVPTLAATRGPDGVPMKDALSSYAPGCIGGVVVNEARYEAFLREEGREEIAA